MSEEEFEEWYAELSDKEKVRYHSNAMGLERLSTRPRWPGWFDTVLFVADTPDRHDEIYRRTPLLVVLAYADRKAQKERERLEAYQKAAKAGNPMALMFLLMR